MCELGQQRGGPASSGGGGGEAKKGRTLKLIQGLYSTLGSAGIGGTMDRVLWG